MVLLIKPQFEAGKELVEKGGVVRSKTVHKDVIKNVIDTSILLGYCIKGLTYSSIKGPSGNIEYLLWISNSRNENCSEIIFDIENIVNEAFDKL